jgi:YHS domain-containing protein
MAFAGLAISAIFHLFGAVPTNRQVSVITSQLAWNYTTWLNIAFLLLIAVLGVRFLRTGGVAMLKEMEHPPSESQERDPVCGMPVLAEEGRETAFFAGVRYWFCSRGCREAFEMNPARYVTRDSLSIRDSNAGSSSIEASS